MNSVEYVFVYGRLRCGFWNELLLRNAKCLGTARTVQAYALYARPMPYVTVEEAVCPVWGEVYAVKGHTLRQIDSLMAHPTWYRRRVTPVLLEDGKEVSAWLYTRRGAGGSLVKSGDLLERTGAAAEPGWE